MVYMPDCIFRIGLCYHRKWLDLYGRKVRFMLRIALCDDEEEARNALCIQLEKAIVEGTEEVVYEFSSGASAVSWLGRHPGEVDLLFLDIEMKGQNGMDTAKKIREFDSNIYIVFVTGYTEYVFDGYGVDALDYIIKPVKISRLMEVLHRVRVKLEQEEDISFSFKNADGTWRFRQQDILYFYSDRRKCSLVTEKGEYDFYAKLDDIEEKIGGQFVRVHQRFLVNPVRVDYMGKDCVEVGRKMLPCSRKYKEEALRKIARSMTGGENG